MKAIFPLTCTALWCIFGSCTVETDYTVDYLADPTIVELVLSGDDGSTVSDATAVGIAVPSNKAVKTARLMDCSGDQAYLAVLMDLPQEGTYQSLFRETQVQWIHDKASGRASYQYQLDSSLDSDTDDASCSGVRGSIYDDDSALYLAVSGGIAKIDQAGNKSNTYWSHNSTLLTSGFFTASSSLVLFTDAGFSKPGALLAGTDLSGSTVAGLSNLDRVQARIVMDNSANGNFLGQINTIDNTGTRTATVGWFQVNPAGTLQTIATWDASGNDGLVAGTDCRLGAGFWWIKNAGTFYRLAQTDTSPVTMVPGHNLENADLWDILDDTVVAITQKSRGGLIAQANYEYTAYYPDIQAGITAAAYNSDGSIKWERVVSPLSSSQQSDGYGSIPCSIQVRDDGVHILMITGKLSTLHFIYETTSGF